MWLQKRGRFYHLKMRVPKRYARIDPRMFIWQSLYTDSEAEAKAKADAVKAEYIAAWELERAGVTKLAEARFEAAKELARRRGFRWLPAGDVAGLSLSDLVERAESATAPSGRPDRFRAEAFLGGAREPALTVSAALEEYWRLTEDKIDEKSPDQQRRWRNPRIKAVQNFIRVAGDLPLAEITADHMLDFRQWWWDRIKSEGLTKNSANKDFTHLGAVLKLVARMKRLGFVPPVSGLAFTEGGANPRPPFPTEFIRDRLLAPAALDGLNTDARTVLLGMINTGYRPSEGAALTAAHIRLDGPIPYIQIAPDGRELKTARAARQIPLAGVSLEAFRALPNGPTRYRDKPGLSATLNKYLRSKGLMPSGNHTVYGLRHAFEDRLLVAGVDERVRRDLMGHSPGGREEYGVGGGLELRLKAVSAIAL